MTESPGRRPGALMISRALKVPRCGQGSLAAPTLGKALQDKLSLVFHFPLITCPFPPWERQGELCLRKSSKTHFFFCEVCLSSASLSVLTSSSGHCHLPHLAARHGLSVTWARRCPF